MKILNILKDISKFPQLINSFESSLNETRNLQSSITALKMALGRIEMRQLENKEKDSIQDYEFKVSSQWGEDGILQFLIKKIPIEQKIFVEFGVENYTEANTRFLLQNNNWAGLIFDGSASNIAFIRNDPIYWKYNLKAECAFIDRENIDGLIAGNGIVGDMGILSVDIDGNDYWVWEAIKSVSPRIVICEYNSLFGSREKVSVPYDKKFYRTDAHFSNLYYGASIAALDFLAKRKGYSLVGSNSSGNNIFFVRNDVLGSMRVKTAAEAYVRAQFRESRNKDGRLTFLDFDDRFKLISAMPLVNVETNNTTKVADLKL